MTRAPADTPQAVGQNALSPEILAQIRGLEIRARRHVGGIGSGNYRSRFRGRGMDFERVREYQPGDDVRHIDWNVTARMRAPYVKEFREERQLTVWLLCDVSGSLDSASTHQLRRDKSLELVAALAMLAVTSQDQVGLVLFSDKVEHVVLPSRGRGHAWRLIRDLLVCQPLGQGTNIDCAIEELTRLARGPTVTFVISDFLAPLQKAILARAARVHELTAVWLTDPRDHTLVDIGLTLLRDAETREVVEVDTHSAQVREAYKTRAETHQEEIQACLMGAGCSVLQILAHEEAIRALGRHLRRRQPRRNR